MKIVHVFDDYGTPGESALPGEGSVPSIVYNLAKTAVEKGHQAEIIERDHGDKPRREKIDRINYLRIESDPLATPPYELIETPQGIFSLVKDAVDVALKLNKALKSVEYDIVHFHFPAAVNFLLYINNRVRNRAVYTAHIGGEKKRFGKEDSLLMKFISPDLHLMQRIRKNVVLNKTIQFYLENRGLENVEMIPNGIDTEKFPAKKEEINRVKKKYGIEDKNVVLFAGTVTGQKGIDILIKASAKVKGGLFLLVGNTKMDKKYFVDMKRLVKELGVEEKVKFTGYLPYKDLKALYTSSQIFVLPSREEGSPIALLEAMASANSLVGSDIPGIKDQIRENWNGYLIEPGNEKELAEKVQYLINNPGRRKSMAENSRKLAKEKFDWENIFKEYLSVYKEIK